MKKYHQLLLLILSVISLSLFLIYRHEYNRLHYVLEVFNFFGQPCNISGLQLSERILNHHDWGPQPIWQDLEHGYVYSAFLTGKIEVKAIALQSDNKNVPRNCYLWFEEKKKPIPGKFKFSRINNDEATGLTSFYYICLLPNIENVPYAVSFSFRPKTRDVEMRKILLTNTLNHNLTQNATICVSPSVFSKKRLIEFISFHKLIGIDSFIIYERDIPHRLSKILTNLSNRLSIQITFFPWNYPKLDNPSIRIIVDNDCLLRTLNQVRFVITLEMNEYIVPSSEQSSFEQITKTIDSSADRISLPVQKFCIENTAADKPIALQNFQVADDYSYNIVRYVHSNHIGGNDVVHTNAVDKALASIHKYVRCNLDPHKVRTDRSMMRFGTDFTRAALIQLLMHDQI